MKKNIIISLAFVLVSITALSQIFIIEKTNGNILELPVESIKEMRFKEDDVTYDDNTPDCVEIVDLGLSVNWASVNLGATLPEEPGYLLAWGEIEEKDWYSWSYYKFGNSKSSLEKYNATDGLRFLQKEDDAATVLWGEKWRMPSREEFQELFDNCYVDYTAFENGYPGVRFTSKVEGYEGRSIFLVAAGWIQDEYHVSVGDLAAYWANECVINEEIVLPEFAFAGEFWRKGDYANRYYYSATYRYLGRPIRAVTTNEDYTEPTIVTQPTFPGDYNIYLNPNDEWRADNAWFALFINNFNTNKYEWITLADNDADGIYEGYVPEGEWTGFKFVRFDSSATTPEWCYALSQTAECTYDGIGDQCNITGTGDAGNAEFYWSVFVPKPQPVEVECVDLGLSVNWAAVNVGANAPEEYGQYLSWGGKEEKEWYSWSYYEFGTSKSSLTKYNTSDGLNTLEATDDAATAMYGSEWRLPSRAEFQELIDYCKIDYNATENGVPGVRITSRVQGYEGNSIFFPAAGYKQDGNTQGEGSVIALWTNECLVGGFMSLPEYALTADFVVGGSYSSSTALRYLGRCIRAVTINQDYEEPVLVPDTVATFEGGYELYLKPTELWANNSAWFAIYAENSNTETSQWITLADTNNDSIYEGVLPEGAWTGFAFCSLNPATTEASWENVWNQTAQFTRDSINNQCTITGTDENNIATCEWSVYVAPAEPSIEYVDLGLSVYWATVNVGATAPEEYGYYVSWGELEEKEWYSWSYYKFGTSKSSLTKYNKTDKQATLEAVDDIATVEYGEGWRMPSKAEFTELFENCNIEYTASENGVNGIRLTSKVAGYEDKSIFIPAGGYKQDNGVMSEGSAACLWTNQCMIGGFSMPEYGFSVNISVLGSYETPTAYRYFGRNVRAVKEKATE